MAITDGYACGNMRMTLWENFPNTKHPGWPFSEIFRHLESDNFLVLSYCNSQFLKVITVTIIFPCYISDIIQWNWNCLIKCPIAKTLQFFKIRKKFVCSIAPFINFSFWPFFKNLVPRQTFITRDSRIL